MYFQAHSIGGLKNISRLLLVRMRVSLPHQGRVLSISYLIYCLSHIVCIDCDNLILVD